MTEDFLHFIWRHKLWDFIGATTTFNESILIKSIGVANNMDGPDFLEASISIGDKLWNGHVEIHIKSSDWFLHNHQNDSKYKPVILHVVFEDDTPNKLNVPTLELKGKIKKYYYNNYLHLLKNSSWLPCGNQLNTFPKPKLQLWLQRLLIERFQLKNEQLKLLLHKENQHWEQVLFIWVMRALGYHYNAEAMEKLAIKIPFSLIQKTRKEENLFTLFLGMSGQQIIDTQAKQLFNHWCAKYKMEPVSNNIWINKVRPQVRPPLVFEKVVTLYVHQNQLFAFIKDCFEQYLLNQELPFDKLKNLSKTTSNHLWLNAFLPVLLLYATSMDNEKWINALWQLMEHIKADNNSLIQKFKNHGLQIKNAAQSQSFIHLYRNYCSLKKCLNCPVGLSLVKTE